MGLGLWGSGKMIGISSPIGMGFSPIPGDVLAAGFAACARKQQQQEQQRLHRERQQQQKQEQDQQQLLFQQQQQLHFSCCTRISAETAGTRT